MISEWTCEWSLALDNTVLANSTLPKLHQEWGWQKTPFICWITNSAWATQCLICFTTSSTTTSNLYYISDKRYCGIVMRSPTLHCNVLHANLPCLQFANLRIHHPPCALTNPPPPSISAINPTLYLPDKLDTNRFLLSFSLLNPTPSNVF